MLALMLNEIRGGPYRRFMQSVIFFPFGEAKPHFIWSNVAEPPRVVRSWWRSTAGETACRHEVRRV